MLYYPQNIFFWTDTPLLATAAKKSVKNHCSFGRGSVNGSGCGFTNIFIKDQALMVMLFIAKKLEKEILF